MEGNKQYKSKFDVNTLSGIVAIIFWGSTVAFSRSLTEQLGTVTAGGLIFLAGSIFAGISLWLKSPDSFKEMFRQSGEYLWGCGSLFLIYMVTLYLAIGLSSSREQVVEVSIINYLWPGLTLIFSIPVLKKRAHPIIILGIILAFIGTYLAMNPYYSISSHQFFPNLPGNIVPYLLALIAAVSWGLYSTLARKWASEDNEGAVPIFLLFTAIVLLALRIYFPEKTVWSLRAIKELIYMAFFPTFLAYSFWDMAMRRGNILLVASLSYLTPLLSVYISSIYLKISIDYRLWVASLLVVIGAFISKYAITDN